MNLINIIFILFSLYFQIPILSSNFIWIFNFWYYLVAFSAELFILYYIFTEPGIFNIVENELRNAFEGTTSENFLMAFFDLIFFLLLIYAGLSNVLVVYTLFTCTYYYIKFFVLPEKNQ